MFIGRDRELDELNRLYKQNDFQLFVLYGRRRVGKTTLLKEFCRDKKSIFFSAEQSNEKLNLDKFSQLIFDFYDEQSLEPFTSWEKAFSYIYKKQIKEQLILVLDEFPYLANINSSILSTLQHLTDHHFKNGKLFIVLCGSYMGFMEKEVLGSKSPLFGRRTAQLQLKPFDYRTSLRFTEGFSDEDKLLLYGIYGGTAMYLKQIRTGESVKENVIHSYLKPTGYLYEEAKLLLQQEVQEPGIYTAIIEAVAGGASKANEIATKTGEESSKCLKYIKTLSELGIIEKEVPFGEKSSSRKTIYSISDFMFRFWYRYVLPNKSLLEMDAQEIIWNRKIEPDLNRYMGVVFERICKDYLLYKNSKGELPFLFTHIGRWWGSNSKREQIEIDLIAQDGPDILFCECKWKNDPLNIQVLNSLVEKSDAFLGKREKIWYALFSKNGFTPAVEEISEQRGNILLVSLKEILEGISRTSVS